MTVLAILNRELLDVIKENCLETLQKSLYFECLARWILILLF